MLSAVRYIQKYEYLLLPFFTSEILIKVKIKVRECDLYFLALPYLALLQIRGYRAVLTCRILERFEGEHWHETGLWYTAMIYIIALAPLPPDPIQQKNKFLHTI